MTLRLLFTVILYTFFISAQAQNDTISCKRSNFPTMYKMDGRNIWSIKKLQRIVKSDVEASAQIKSGKKISYLGATFFMASAYVIGAELGRSHAGNGEMRPAIIAVGAGFLGVSIPLFITSRKRIGEGVRTYNSHVRKAP